MHKSLYAALAALSLAAWILLPRLDVRDATLSARAPAEASGGAIAKALDALLASLDDAQRAKAVFGYDDKERFNWHFIPRERKGLPLGELDAAQTAKADALLAASLSAAGVRTVAQVRSLESVLAEIEGPNRRFPRDPDLYFVSVFGKPSADGAWGWRFEGHHLALNFTLEGDTLVSSTPLFFGANPAEVMSGPKKGLRVLGPVEDAARELVQSLDEEQRAVAVGKEKPAEVEGTESAVYSGDRPTGLSADRLTQDQRKILRKLVNQHLKHVEDGSRDRLRREFLRGKLAQIQFVWRGGLAAGEGHSFLVHSPDFVISYANFQNDAKHIHSGLRALRGEFGHAAPSDASAK